MADYPVMDGDIVQFKPAFGGAQVIVLPGTITGSGKTTSGSKICVEGDEGSVKVEGVPYVMPPFVVPGTGTLTIASLLPDQLSIKTSDSGKKIILKGGSFIAKFQVQSPAKDAQGIPSPVTSMPGTGEFLTMNLKTKIA